MKWHISMPDTQGHEVEVNTYEEAVEMALDWASIHVWQIDDCGEPVEEEE